MLEIMSGPINTDCVNSTRMHDCYTKLVNKLKYIICHWFTGKYWKWIDCTEEKRIKYQKRKVYSQVELRIRTSISYRYTATLRLVFHQFHIAQVQNSRQNFEYFHLTHRVDTYSEIQCFNKNTRHRHNQFLN